MRGGSYGHLGVAYPPLMPPPGAMMVPYQQLPQQQQQHHPAGSSKKRGRSRSMDGDDALDDLLRSDSSALSCTWLLWHAALRVIAVLVVLRGVCQPVSQVKHPMLQMIQCRPLDAYQDMFRSESVHWLVLVTEPLSL